MKKLIFGLMFLTGPLYAGPVQTVTVNDDEISPITKQKVVVETIETKEVKATDFEGTAVDLDDMLVRLKAQRDSLNDRITSYENLKQKIETELEKLPPRRR